MSRREESAGLSRKLALAHRYLCGVPYQDLRIDPHHAECVQEAARFFEETEQFSHVVTNVGWTEERFRLARLGAGKSNIDRGGCSIEEHVDRWIFDRRDRVGHRVLALCPELQQAAFGRSSSFATM